MKSILVPVEEHRLAQPVLETALLLGLEQRAFRRIRIRQQ
jgi:hypothetical protein